MVNGSLVKTEGSVKILLKYEAYHEVVEAQVSPRLDKPMILGITWLRIETPRID